MTTTTTIHVAGDRHSIERGVTQCNALYELAKLQFGPSHLLLELPDDRDIPLAPNDFIVIRGSERFSISKEPYPADDNPCLRQPLRPVFNDEPLTTDRALPRSKLDFNQLVALDEHFEPGDGLFVDLKDLPDVQLREPIRLVVQAHDHLYTSPCGNVGFGGRLQADLAALCATYGHIDVIDEGARHLLVLRDQALPNHWSRPSTDILLQVPQAYPMAALDMFWVRPGLTLRDGRLPANGDYTEPLAGEPWQRFSWHYAQPTWNPAVDGLLSHMRFVRVRLAQAH